jgi:hypothetical protein
MARSATTTRTAEWRKLAAAHKESGRGWRDDEAERRKVFRALVKPAAAIGIDLKAMTEAGRARFETQCAAADKKLKRKSPQRGKKKR